MNLDTAYCFSEEPWRNIKKYVKPESIHIAMLVVSYDDERHFVKKSIANTVSRLNVNRGQLFIKCHISRISDVIEFTEELCNNEPDLMYNIVSYQLSKDRDMFFGVFIEHGDNEASGQVGLVTLRDSDALKDRFRRRLMESSMAQDIVLFIGDCAFSYGAAMAKNSCRYVIGLTTNLALTKCISDEQGISVVQNVQ